MKRCQIHYLQQGHCVIGVICRPQALLSVRPSFLPPSLQQPLQATRPPHELHKHQEAKLSNLRLVIGVMMVEEFVFPNAKMLLAGSLTDELDRRLST